MSFGVGPSAVQRCVLLEGVSDPCGVVTVSCRGMLDALLLRGWIEWRVMGNVRAWVVTEAGRVAVGEGSVG